MTENDDVKRWTSRSFEIISFELTDKYVAVFAEVAADGLTDLWTEELDAVGLARVSEQWWSRKGSNTTKLGDPDTYDEVIGLGLFGGDWSISNEHENFAGLMKVGGDKWTVTHYLDRRKYATLRHEKQVE